MLHVRDCSGLLSNGDVCPFPWCRKVKHLLYHLVSCKKDDDGNQCSVCSPPEKNLSTNLVALVGLNTHRRIKFRERVKAGMAKRQQLAAAASIARVSFLGKEKATLEESGTRLTNLPHPANISRDLTNGVAKVAPMNQASQRHAHFTMSHQQQGALSPNQISTSQIPESSFVFAQSSTTASIGAATTLDSPPNHHLTSPALSATLTGLSSSLSVSALPSLEEAALELGDISLSTSDLLDLAPLSEPLSVTAATASTEHAALR